MTKQSITEEELKAFMTAMRKRYDLDFTNYEPKSLSRGISRLMTKHKMHGMVDLWTRILQDDDFFLSSIDDLLVNLTELFRNPDAWLKIRDEVLPEFQYADNINIWHAGCSTGEEICTMSIVLESCGLLSRSNTLATDLSDRALNTARKGIYPENRMNNYSKPFKEFFPHRELGDFFNFDGNTAQIKPHYLKHVTFKKQNLVDLAMDQKFDIIFCRNVLIYFDGELKARILKFLKSCLKDHGFLVLGYYDTMPNASIDIFDIHDNNTRIYKNKLSEMIEA